MVSGKDVIKKLSEWSQRDYRVSFNSEKLARELRREEILLEMKNVIRAIEKNLDLT